MNKEELTKDYIEKLKTAVFVLDSKLMLYIHLNDKRKDNLEEINFAKSFFEIVYHSLLSDIIISLSRLFNGKRSGRNIIQFLDFVEANYNLFSTESFNRRFGLSTHAQKLKHRKINKTTINSHRKIIISNNDLLTKLKIWRDKMYGHSDEEYFHNPDKIIFDAPLKFNQLRSLIQLAGEIVNRYSVAFDGSVKQLNALNFYDVDNIFTSITHYRNSLD